MLHQSLRQVVLVHLVFTALGFILFSPMIAGVGRLLIMISGQPALDDQDILYFFLTPSGMFAAVLMLALFVTILAFEQAALMRLAVDAKQGQHSNIVQLSLFSLTKARRLFAFVVRLVTRVLLLVLPFLAMAYGIVKLLVSDYDINYYLVQKPAEFWWACGLTGVLLLIMLVVLVYKLLAWSLALPLVLFTEVSPRKSFSDSAGITKNSRLSVFTVLMVWALLTSLLGIVLMGIVTLIGSWTIPVARESLSTLVLLLGGFSVLWVLGNFLLTAFTSGSFAFLLIGFYDLHGPPVSVPITMKSQTASVRLRFSPGRLVVLLLAGVLLAGAMGVWLIEGVQPNDDVIIVAHRGAAGKAPENTLAAFNQAIDDKTDWIELDVQETADGKVVVFHDSDFMQLAGDRTRVWQATLAEIDEIDIGSWFDPGFSEQRAPTLSEVLESVKGRANVVIELKYYGHDQMLEQRVVDIVEATGMVNQTAIMSLRYDAIEKVRVLRPDWQIGLLSVRAIGNLARLDTDFLAVEKAMASSGFIRRVHRAGKKVFVWTINDPVTMSRMMSLGVDGIITDEPELARRVLQQRKEMNIAERLLIHTTLIFGQPFTPRQYRDDSP